jgi:GNAT superfamily N-acetyltransferase
VHDRAVPTVIRCPSAARERALQTVVAAFRTDPLLRWVWPSDERYGGCAPAFFGTLLDGRFAGGEVWSADDGAAIAMWDPPGGLYVEPPAQCWEAVRAEHTAPERDAWDSYHRAMSLPEGNGPYWYLGVLATEPARQGTGLGRAVTAPMLTAADRSGLPAYLETASEENVTIYRRLGFEPVHEESMPDSGPTCWLMRRDPRPVSS